MRSVARLVPAVAAALLISSVPAGADQGIMGYGPSGQKDECLIVARNCGVESIDARVERLEREIAKGTAVYSEGELERMKGQLREFSRVQQINENHFPPVPALI